MVKKEWEKPDFQILTFCETAGSGKANVRAFEDFIEDPPGSNNFIPNNTPEAEGPS